MYLSILISYEQVTVLVWWSDCLFMIKNLRMNLYEMLGKEGLGRETIRHLGLS